ncbi:hypothetical protein RIF29_33885 [Crotalaria pallida]|uniref:Uncharacterized protein n=1 Tax=Crotalaria pallida TaxID=3830 RepID=A0AAN9EE40_CROPI
MNQALMPNRAHNKLVNQRESNSNNSSPTTLTKQIESGRTKPQRMKEKEKVFLHRMQILHKQAVNGIDNAAIRVHYHEMGMVASSATQLRDDGGGCSAATEPPDRDGVVADASTMEIDMLGSGSKSQKKIGTQSAKQGLEGQPSSLLQ